MSLAIDIVLTQFQPSVANVVKTATAVDLDAPAFPPKTALAPVATPTAAAPAAVTPVVAPVAPVVAPVAPVDPLAAFHENLDAIKSGKQSLINQPPGLHLPKPGLDTASVHPYLDKNDFGPLQLNKIFPLNVDEMKSEELGSHLRGAIAFQGDDKAWAKIKDQRILEDPKDPNIKRTPEEAMHMYINKASDLPPESVAAYKKALWQSDDEMQKLMPKVQNGIASYTTSMSNKIKQDTDQIAKDPNALGFNDWLKSSWSNIAVPAGLLLMLFGGDTGKLLGGLAVAAGGYDLYNRYNTMTKDPTAQTAIKEFIDGGMSNEALAKIRSQYGEKSATAAMDFMAATRYGFASHVNGAIQGAGMKAYKAFNPTANEKNLAAFQQRLPQAEPDQKSWTEDWATKAPNWVSQQYNNIMGNTEPVQQ